MYGSVLINYNMVNVGLMFKNSWEISIMLIMIGCVVGMDNGSL